MEKNKLAIYTHDDTTGYHCKYGSEKFKEEEIYSRTSRADPDVPEKGVTNKLLVYPLVSNYPILIEHKDSEKVPGGETRPAHHIEAYSIIPDKNEVSKELMPIFIGAAFGCCKIICLNNDDSISIAVDTMLISADILPQEIKKYFHIRLVEKNEVLKHIEHNIDYFLISEKNDIIYLKNNTEYSYYKDLNYIRHYINDVIKDPSGTISEIEKSKNFSIETYLDIIKKRYTEYSKISDMEHDFPTDNTSCKEVTIREREALFRITKYISSKINKRRLFKRRWLMNDLNDYFISIQSPTQKEIEFINLITSFAEYNSSSGLYIFIQSLISYIDKIESGYHTSLSYNQLKSYYRILKKIERTDLLKYIYVDGNKKAVKLYDKLTSKL